MPELLIATTTTVVAAVLVAGCLTPRGGVAFVLAVALLAQAMIVASLAIAGLVLRSLAPEVLLALALAWAAVGALAAWRSGRRSGQWAQRLRGGVASLLGALAYPPVAIAALLVVATAAWRLFLAFRLPIVDYDGWSYHLVFADVWLQHNALTLVPQRPWTAGYPAATEMLTTWLMAFTHTDAPAAFTSILPIPLAIAATTGLARAFGADRSKALLAGLLFAMTPALVALAGTSYVDAASVATVTATWWLGLRVVRGERDRSAAVLLGLAGGLALGSKGTNALLVAPILGVAGLLLCRDLLVALRRDHPPAARPATAIAVLALFVLPVLALGVSWYVKNIVVYANPMYPFAMGPFQGPSTLTDFVLHPPQLEGRGKLGQIALSWIADWDITRYVYNTRPGGLGRAWLAILAFALGGGLLLLRRRQVAALVLVVLPAAITLLVMPMPWYARLTLFLPAVALPLAAVALSALRPRLALAGSLALVLLAAVSLVLANARPNIDLRPEYAHLARPGQYLGFVLDQNDARRSNVSLRAQCAGFSAIPAGARVASGGFSLLHGVVGPDLSRIIADPLAPVSTPEELVTAMQAVGATWLVTTVGASVDDLAAAAPVAFQDHGEICQGGRLWELQPGS